MSYRFPSDEWIRELSRLLNESESYRSSAQDCEGDFVFEIQPDEAFADTAYLFLGLHHGKSPEAALLSSSDERDAAYCVSAPYGTWRKVIDGVLDPIQGMMMQ